MTATVWSGKARIAVFELLPTIELNGKKVNYYTRDWTSKAPQFSVKEWREVEILLLAKLIKGGYFPNKKPKSSRSVGMIIHHVIAPQNHPGYRKLRAQCRFAAYYSGFMEQTDIVYLEDKARKKHGDRVDIKGEID